MIRILRLLPAALLLLGAGSTFPAYTSAADAGKPDEVAALEKKLGAARDEVAALKTALAISKSQTAAAEARVSALARSDSELDSLRAAVRVLERDLQSATAALQRVVADKAAADAALRAAGQLPPAAPAGTALRPLAADGAAIRKTTTADPKIASLEAELREARARAAAAETGIAARETEVSRLRSRLAAAEAQPAIPASVTRELDDLRKQVAASLALEDRMRQLEQEKAAGATRLAEAEAAKETLQRDAAARAEMERKLAAMENALRQATHERDELRAQAAKADDLASRVRQLEAEKLSTLPASNSTGGVSQEAFARTVAAHQDAERKLSTVLRSFTLLSKERDELRARLAELTAKSAGSQEKRPE